MFFRGRRDGDTFTVSSHVREHMPRELMTVETPVEIVDAGREELRHGERPGSTLVLCDNTGTWIRSLAWTPCLLTLRPLGLLGRGDLSRWRRRPRGSCSRALSGVGGGSC
jgi:hypothetical protein